MNEGTQIPSNSSESNTGRSTTAHIEGTEDELIVGAKKGYAYYKRSSRKLEYVKKVWDESDGPGKEER